MTAIAFAIIASTMIFVDHKYASMRENWVGSRDSQSLAVVANIFIGLTVLFALLELIRR